MKRFCLTASLLILTMTYMLGTTAEARSDVIYFNGDSYAAIAYSPETGNFGCAYNFGSRWAAERAALAKCRAADARIVTWVNNGFCALALGNDRSTWGVGYSYGDGATNSFARIRALEECQKRTTGARIVCCACSTNVPPEINL